MKNTKYANIRGVIHARGGSVRLPLKNIKRLCGKPLISYMIKAALESRLLGRVIVSTDHPKIKAAALKYGGEVPFSRPENISGDCASTLVTQHAAYFIEKKEGKKIDIIVTLQPTSPFCKGSDIDECIKLLLRNKNLGSVFSAVEITEYPEWMFTLKGRNKAEPYIPGRWNGKRALRRYLNKMVVPNGAIYATRRDNLFKENALITKMTAAYLMPRERSVDIDEKLDFEFAEFMAKKRKL
ncbi:MAG: acylneuraminate cytidylyltransferase family protein [Candidatus Omnitrophica bacterium]|nr:acylneuraminate cytidylyltransferase family protein [Candidatus Omnitrophota bacterium]